MKIFFTDTFKKHYQKRIAPHEELRKRFRQRREFFIHDRSHPLLKDHSLSGSKKGYRAFSITGDIRVIYIIEDNTVYFIDIGTHNQVYE